MVAQDRGPEEELVRRMIDGDEKAKKEFSDRYTGIVRYLAFRLCQDKPDLREELISSGHVALVESAYSFDPHIGGRFSTYAHLKIRFAMLTYINRSLPLVPPPEDFRRFAQKVLRVKRQLYFRIEREPTVEEIATETKSSPEKVNEALELLDQTYTTDWDSSYNDDSLDRIIKDDELEEMWEALNEMKPEDAKILIMYHIDGHTFSEIEHALGLKEGTAKGLAYRNRIKARKYLRREK